MCLLSISRSWRSQSFYRRLEMLRLRHRFLCVGTSFCSRATYCFFQRAAVVELEAPHVACRLHRARQEPVPLPSHCQPTPSGSWSQAAFALQGSKGPPLGRSDERNLNPERKRKRSAMTETRYYAFADGCASLSNLALLGKSSCPSLRPIHRTEERPDLRIQRCADDL